MATVLPLRTAWIADVLSQASLRDVQRQRCWKRGRGPQTGRDGGTTTRLSYLSMPFPLCGSPLKGEVRRSPEQSARQSAAADHGEANLCHVLIRGELWIVLMLSPIVRDVQRQRGSGHGQRLSLYNYGMMERSFDAVERRGSTLNLNSLHGRR